MTINQLTYATTVARTKNISAAADELFLSQPSLTKAISELEKEMHVTIFIRNNRGVTVTSEGEIFLSYAQQLLERVQYLEDRFKGGTFRNPVFSVSCQHYIFAVNAMIDLIKQYDAPQYDFTLRETKTHEILEDVASAKSELGILYLSSRNLEVITKQIKKNNLSFVTLYETVPHVFLSKDHPLAGKKSLTLEELFPYPYLTFEQGEYNSFYYAEELISPDDIPKNIKVRDRASMFNLLIGLNGFTVSSGITNRELNGQSMISRPLIHNDYIKIGYIHQKNRPLSSYASTYIDAIGKYLINQ